VAANASLDATRRRPSAGRAASGPSSAAVAPRPLPGTRNHLVPRPGLSGKKLMLPKTWKLRMSLRSHSVGAVCSNKDEYCLPLVSHRFASTCLCACFQDCVRFIAWHPSRLCFASGGDDSTVRYWSLPAAITEKATAGTAPASRKLPGIEPLRTLRGHVGPVLCAATATNVTISDTKVMFPSFLPSEVVALHAFVVARSYLPKEPIVVRARACVTRT
jgi:WD40 repeat protein